MKTTLTTGRRSARSLYYYTDFNTLSKILQNGTLRFKESTSSNDILDTIQFYEKFREMAEKRLKERGLTEKWPLLSSALNKQEYESVRVSLVACFSKKSDSRLLWDAYTMNRKGRSSERYNGVCIEFAPDALKMKMNRSSNTFDFKSIKPIVYGYERVRTPLENVLYDFCVRVSGKSERSAHSQDSSKSARISVLTESMTADQKEIIARAVQELKNQFDKIAPFYKHEFWYEEEEVRALLSVKRESINDTVVRQDDTGALYYNLPIDYSCIKKMILGPEFSSEDYSQLSSIDGKIRITDIRTEQSIGTGVITNK